MNKDWANGAHTRTEESFNQLIDKAGYLSF